MDGGSFRLPLAHGVKLFGSWATWRSATPNDTATAGRPDQTISFLWMSPEWFGNG